MRILTLSLLLVTLTACATSRVVMGSDLEALRALEPGKATKADVVALAGQPLMRVPGPDNTETWTYTRTEARGFAFSLLVYTYTEASPQQKSATLTFRREVLERIEWK